MVQVTSWAHTRPKFYQAQASDRMRSTGMLAHVRLSYDEEREARDMQPERKGRLALRRAK